MIHTLRRVVCGVLLVSIGPVWAEDVEPTSREQLNAVLWMQTAPEYRANVLQTWRLATERLHVATQPGSAAVEQESLDHAQLMGMPTAIVLDVDETVLDNSVYQAQLLRERRKFEPATWAKWVVAAKSEAIPGALEFVREAVGRGHNVFYLTNRDCFTKPETGADPCPQLTGTMRNLDALGFPNALDPTNYLLQGQRPEWASSAKTQRRAWIGERYRILMLIGDDLGDFVDQRTFAARRDELTERFGKRWFVLPNAMYGSWERGFADIEAKYAALDVEGRMPDLRGSRNWTGGRLYDRVRIATWNVEYLILPQTHAALRDTCAEEGDSIRGWQRLIPCTIGRRPSRGAADFAALRKYAERLDADVVALQETDGPEAAALVFPGYDFCFSTRPHVQKNGFAIRRGLSFRCEDEYLPLSLNDEVRRGVVVTLFPGTNNAMTLMSVHLKSGCPAGPLTAAGRNCQLIRGQIAPLEDWIEEQARAGRRFAVLGDFNRRFSLERLPARDVAGNVVSFWPEIDDGDPPASDLVDITAGRKFQACNQRDPFTEYIDTVLLGRDLARSAIRSGFVRVTYDAEDVGKMQLSDHCAVGIDLRLSGTSAR
jgi:5'-nucleotidase (lipoprotein e(P4) family)